MHFFLVKFCKNPKKKYFCPLYFVIKVMRKVILLIISVIATLQTVTGQSSPSDRVPVPRKMHYFDELLLGNITCISGLQIGVTLNPGSSGFDSLLVIGTDGLLSMLKTGDNGDPLSKVYNSDYLSTLWDVNLTIPSGQNPTWTFTGTGTGWPIQPRYSYYKWLYSNSLTPVSQKTPFYYYIDNAHVSVSVLVWHNGRIQEAKAAAATLLTDFSATDYYNYPLPGAKLLYFSLGWPDNTVNLYLRTVTGVAVKPAAGGHTVKKNGDFTFSAKTYSGYTVIPKVEPSVYDITATRGKNDTIHFTVNKLGTDALVTLSYEQSYFSVSPLSLSYGSAGGPQWSHITTNTDWTATTSASWITLLSSSGTGDDYLGISPAVNTGAARSATVIVRRGDGGGTATISVTQASGLPAPQLEISASEMTFYQYGGSRKVTVTSNTYWSAATSEPWVQVTPDRGVGNGELTVTIPNSMGYAPRTGSVTITVGAIYRFIAVHQLQTPDPNLFLTLSEPLMWFASEDCNQALTVSSNGTWTVTSSDSWLKTSLSEGEGSASMYVTAEANSTLSARSATLTFTCQHLSRTVIVTQDAYDPSYNFSIDKTYGNNLRIWANEGMIHLQSTDSKLINLYSLTGSLLLSREISAGITQIPVKQGIYILKTGSEAKKIMVK